MRRLNPALPVAGGSPPEVQNRSKAEPPTGRLPVRFALILRRKNTERVDFAAPRSTNKQSRGSGRRLADEFSDARSRVPGSGSRRVAAVPRAHVDAFPYGWQRNGNARDETLLRGRIPMKLETWPGGRHKKGDDDNGTPRSFNFPREKSF